MWNNGCAKDHAAYFSLPRTTPAAPPRHLNHELINRNSNGYRAPAAPRHARRHMREEENYSAKVQAKQPVRGARIAQSFEGKAWRRTAVGVDGIEIALDLRIMSKRRGPLGALKYRAFFFF